MNIGQASKAVITVPVNVHRSVVKHRQKSLLKRLEQTGTKYFEGHRNLPPIIACRVPQLHHYRGQVYSPYKSMPMASEHWASRGTIGDFFTIVPFHGNYASDWSKFSLLKLQEQEEATGDSVDPQLIEHLKSPSFSAYNFDKKIVETLTKLGFRSPTNIQDAAFPKLMTGENGIVASETGNGKTLAFLLPVIQRVLDLKNSMPSLKDRTLNSPLSVVITPGRELASQIFEVAQQICSEVGIKARLELGGSIDHKILFGDRAETDIVIGSLGGLRKLFHGNLLHRDYITSIVLDEADTLVDDSFSGKTLGFLTYLSSQTNKMLGTGTQFVFVGATFPNNIRNALRNLMDTDQLSLIRTHYLHRVLSHIRQKFIRAPKCERPAYLLDVIEHDVEKSKPVLIFSNKTSTSAFVSHFLCGRGIECKHFSANIDWRVRGKILEEFLSGKFKVLSCTDLVSRGIDTTNVAHVVNYDFPSNVSDYVHRVGRVGRIGASQPNGHVTSLVCGLESIKIVQQIERSVRTNTEIKDVDSNIVRILRKRHRGREVAHEEETEVEDDESREVSGNRKSKDYEPYTPLKSYSRRPKREEI